MSEDRPPVGSRDPAAALAEARFTLQDGIRRYHSHVGRNGPMYATMLEVGEAEAIEAALDERDRLLSPESMERALQAAWSDFCSDTGCFPDCFEWRGRKLYADFSRGNFARMVSAALAFHNPQDRDRPKLADPHNG